MLGTLIVLVVVVAAAMGVLAGPFSIVIPLAIHGALGLAARLGLLPSWVMQEDPEEPFAVRQMQIRFGAIELVSVWASVSVAGYWVAHDGHYVVVGGIVGVFASATTVGLIRSTRAFNNALVALIPAAMVAVVVAPAAAHFVL